LRSIFESIVGDVEKGISFVPLSFVLGFYATVVVNRYWKMWDDLPRPDGLAARIASAVEGNVCILCNVHVKFQSSRAANPSPLA
jgi:hypothetical protein